MKHARGAEAPSIGQNSGPAIEPQPLAYRIPDASRVSGLSKSRLYELEAEGKLKFSRIGRRTLVIAADLRKLIADGQL